MRLLTILFVLSSASAVMMPANQTDLEKIEKGEVKMSPKIENIVGDVEGKESPKEDNIVLEVTDNKETPTQDNRTIANKDDTVVEVTEGMDSSSPSHDNEIREGMKSPEQGNIVVFEVPEDIESTEQNNMIVFEVPEDIESTEQNNIIVFEVPEVIESTEQNNIIVFEVPEDIESPEQSNIIVFEVPDSMESSPKQVHEKLVTEGNEASPKQVNEGEDTEGIEPIPNQVNEREVPEDIEASPKKVNKDCIKNVNSTFNTSMSAEAFTSSRQWFKVQGIDLLMRDIKSIPNVRRIEDCKEECAKTPACESCSVTGQLPGGTCWLKQSAKNYVLRADVDSYLVVPDKFECAANSDFYGHDIMHDRTSFNFCAQACSSLWKLCNGFTWVLNENDILGACYLKRFNYNAELSPSSRGAIACHKRRK